MNAYQVPTDPTAVLGRRLLAYVLDGIILLIVPAILAIAAVSNMTTYEGEGRSVDELQEICDQINDTTDDLCFVADPDIVVTSPGNAALFVSAGLLYLVLIIVNNVVVEGRRGAGIGKSITGIRVVRRDTGAVCGIGKAFLRQLLWIVDSTCLIGPITALATKGHRRVGDMAAGTLVVAASSVGTVPFVPGLDGPAVNPAPWGGAPPAWGTSAPPPPAVPSGAWGTAPAPGSTPPPPAPGGWTVGTPPATDWTAPPPGDFAAPPAPLSPVPPSEPAPMSSPAPAEQPGVDAPMWDEARGTYIQWDPALQQWMQWDDVAKQWTAIG